MAPKRTVPPPSSSKDRAKPSNREVEAEKRMAERDYETFLKNRGRIDSAECWYSASDKLLAHEALTVQ